MKFNKYHIYILLLTIICIHSNAHAVLLKAGTTIPVRLIENVNGNMSNTGQTIYFEVTENIYVDNTLVIPEKTFVKGKVLQAVGRASLGKGGKLVISGKNLKTHDNKTVLFEEESLTAQGRKRTGATVAHVIAWGPLGLFAKGRAAFILLGSEYDLIVEKDIELSEYIPEPASEEINPKYTINAQFEKYKRSINYRKGKIGSNFNLIVKDENHNMLKKLKNSDIEIKQILSHKLRKSIKPVKMIWDKRKEELIVQFDFQQIVKYLVPGSSEIKLHINGDKNYIVDTALETKWKLK